MMVFIFSYSVARSFTLSITHDEGLTYLHHVTASYWEIITYGNPWPSNNHLLNSLLAKVGGAVFGLSEASMRWPALLGHGLFLVSTYRICRLFLHGKKRAIGFLFIALNPYVLDFFSCSRGYGLGLGTFAAACYFFFVCVKFHADSQRYNGALAWCLAFAVLSTLSNLVLPVLPE